VGKNTAKEFSCNHCLTFKQLFK